MPKLSYYLADEGENAPPLEPLAGLSEPTLRSISRREWSSLSDLDPERAARDPFGAKGSRLARLNSQT